MQVLKFVHFIPLPTLQARKAQEIRVRAMDAKRQKLKDKLDKGEKLHEEELDMKQDEEAKFAAEVERLRKEGSRQLQEEQEAMKKQMEEEARAQRPYPSFFGSVI